MNFVEAEIIANEINEKCGIKNLRQYKRPVRRERARKLPEEFYKWYKPTREAYAKRAKLAMRDELRRRNEARQQKKRGRGRPPKSEN